MLLFASESLRPLGLVMDHACLRKSQVFLIVDMIEPRLLNHKRMVRI